nr:hypothetical protein [Tanacetum cinerariifolium]
MSSQFVISMLNLNPDTGIDSLFELTHRVDVPVSTTVVPLLVTIPTLPPPFIPIMSQVQQAPAPTPTTAPSSFLQDLLNFGSLFGFDHHLKNLEANFSEFMQTNQFAESVSSILGIVDRYIDHRMNEAVKVAVQIQFDRLRDEAQAENEYFLNKLDENIQKIIKEKVKEQVKISYAVAADLSDLELKKILIEKMERNKSIHRSDKQRNLYKALVDAYECDKIILDTYGDTITLKRRRDDADKDKEPLGGSDQGSKRRREGKGPESTSALKEKASKTTDYGHIKWIEDLVTWYLAQCGVKHRSAMINMLSGESLIRGTNVNSSMDLRSTGSLFEMSTPNVESSLSPNFRLTNAITTSTWIGSLKADQSHCQRTLCFQRLFKNVHEKRSHPTACERSSIRCQKLPKEAQPDTYRTDLKRKEAYTAYSNLRRFIYENKDKQNRLMRIDELHKFSDGTLNDVRSALYDRLKGIRMKYLPQTIWRRSDKERAAAMIQAIDK